MDEPAYFIEKARQCRRLAAAVPNQNDPAVRAVLEMAREFEARAAARAEKADD